MKGTMFHIKSILNLSPAGKIEINKLFSHAPRASKDYGETQLSDGNWACYYFLWQWNITSEKKKFKGRIIIYP